MATTPLSPFVFRHLGPRAHEIRSMLQQLGYESLDKLCRAVVPQQIALEGELQLPAGVDEDAALNELRELAAQNKVVRSLIGQGYYGTSVPKVIQRNVLENPAWYTAYTPYQPEISQGRLEILFYFQTMVAELTGLDIANASLLDEATAAAEAMAICARSDKKKRHRFLVSSLCHPQTIEVIQTRATPMGVQVELFDETNPIGDWNNVFGLIVQYPATDGSVRDYESLFAAAHERDVMCVAATDLLALVVLGSPGSQGADVAVGNSQRFGVPLGLGGPHAAFLATRDAYKRTMPGRLVGLSVDRHGKPAYRLALQTREQHIRREKATSNICTAQALLAIMATLYACYHGPDGLRSIALRVHGFTVRLANTLRKLGFSLQCDHYFDTLAIDAGDRTEEIMQSAADAGFNLRRLSDRQIGISLDERTTEAEVRQLMAVFGGQELATDDASPLDTNAWRTDRILPHDVFHKYHSETEMMRYLRRLSEMDLALDRAMIPLGSCTMKLNAASELTPVTWPEFNDIHPLAPPDQWIGYRKLVEQLESMLCTVTGYDAVSLQPNAGSQGEYAGLLAIMQYHAARGDSHRDVCLIPSSAHGTNPASAQMANMQVVVVKCDDQGNIDLADLDAKIAQHAG
ncbi:MAG TPA: aminomethyl-transferring glycine dehydrogenase, partial [Pirellulaceae bacterium]|nr:aminomethyl-transferring glycine dehydrogenase [Pirellulaceae bacterium]